MDHNTYNGHGERETSGPQHMMGMGGDKWTTTHDGHEGWGEGNKWSMGWKGWASLEINFSLPFPEIMITTYCLVKH